MQSVGNIVAHAGFKLQSFAKYLKFGFLCIWTIFLKAHDFSVYGTLCKPFIGKTSVSE